MKKLYKRFEFEFKYTALVIIICVVVCDSSNGNKRILELKLLKGFMVDENDNVVPDEILLCLERVEVTNRKKTMSYMDYMKWKLESLYERFNELCDSEWSTRDENQSAQINYYIKAIKLTEELLKEER